MKKTMGEFSLEIKGGEFTDSEIVVMLGENGEFKPSCLLISRLILLSWRSGSTY